MPRRALLPTLLLLLACRGDGDDSAGPTGPRGDCDPVAPTLCGLPFPSTFYMAEDATTATGWRVALGPTTLPVNENDQQPDPWIWNERDGWSPLTPMMAHFPGLDVGPLPGHATIDASLLADSPTVLVDVDTGERMPHWAELDMSQDVEDERMLILHPAVPLRYGHRYAVGLRGLRDTAGADIAPSPAFLALRDGGDSDDFDVVDRRAVYEDLVFPALEAAGVERGELTLAWDFVVGSQQGITGRAVWMRDDALDRLGGAPTYTIDRVDEFAVEEDAHTARRIYGTLTAPLYTEEDAPGTLLTRGDDGMPYYNGDTEVPFTIVVPRSLVDEARPGLLIQYGHGLLGGQGEVESGWLAEAADENGWLLFAVDWTGMKTDDADQIALMTVNSIDRFAMIPERSQQGFVEFLAAAAMMRSDAIQGEASLQATGADGAAVSLVDAETLYFYGISQGAILGASYVALAPDIERVALGVGGMPYSLLLYRSQDFEPFFLIFKTMYDSPLEIALWMGMFEAVWDSGEGAGWARSLTDEPVQGAEPKSLLMQVAIGDHQVSTLGAHVGARSVGARLIGTPAREVWGLETAESGWTGSALVEFEYGIAEPATNIPPTDGEDPHESPRRDKAGQAQIDHFFRTGEVVDFCEGVCGSAGR
jgi:hypothetical protein